MRTVDWCAIGAGAVTMFIGGLLKSFPLVDLVALTGGVTAMLYGAIATFRSIREDTIAYQADIHGYLHGRLDVDTVIRRMREREARR